MMNEDDELLQRAISYPSVTLSVLFLGAFFNFSIFRILFFLHAMSLRPSHKSNDILHTSDFAHHNLEYCFLIRARKITSNA